VVRIVVVLCLLVVVAVWIARWWFWGRMQFRAKRIECSLSVAELYRKVGVDKRRATELRDAASLGDALRDAGLRLLEKDGVRLAKKRRVGWWNLRLVPAFFGIILVFSLVSSQFPRGLIIALGCLIVVLHVLLRISGIGIELQAVKRGWQALHEQGGLRRMDEEEAVLRCARASVWNTVLPW
jgi:hypothetical protein